MFVMGPGVFLVCSTYLTFLSINRSQYSFVLRSQAAQAYNAKAIPLSKTLYWLLGIYPFLKNPDTDTTITEQIKFTYRQFIAYLCNPEMPRLKNCWASEISSGSRGGYQDFQKGGSERAPKARAF